MSVTLGENDYRTAGLERLRESALLLNAELYTGSVYLSGRAVECMLRALIWKYDGEIRHGRKSLQTGHNLRDMLMLIADLGVLKDYENRHALTAQVEQIGRLWFNNMRFLPTPKLRAYWWKLGEVSAKRTVKKAAEDFQRVSITIVRSCEALCEK